MRIRIPLLQRIIEFASRSLRKAQKSLQTAKRAQIPAFYRIEAPAWHIPSSKRSACSNFTIFFRRLKPTGRDSDMSQRHVRSVVGELRQPSHELLLRNSLSASVPRTPRFRRKCSSSKSSSSSSPQPVLSPLLCSNSHPRSQCRRAQLLEDRAFITLHFCASRGPE